MFPDQDGIRIFFDYVEARKKEFQQRELKRLGLGGEGGTAE